MHEVESFFLVDVFGTEPRDTKRLLGTEPDLTISASFVRLFLLRSEQRRAERVSRILDRGLRGLVRQDSVTAERRTMIIRVWQGRTSAADADGYERFLKKTAYPDYGEVPGNRGWILLRRRVSDIVEFMFVSFWDSMEALAKYTGGRPGTAEVLP